MARRTTGAESEYRETKRDRLLEVCAELIARRGFAATTVREIGEAAGLLSGSLYYYFDSKEAILEQLVRKLQAHLWEQYGAVVASEASPREKLEGVIRASTGAIDRYNDIVRIYQNETKVLEQNERFQEMASKSKDFEAMVTGFLTDGVAAGQFRSDLRIVTAFRFIRDSIWPIVHWYRPGGDLTIDEVTDDYLGLLFEGLGA